MWSNQHSEAQAQGTKTARQPLRIMVNGLTCMYMCILKYDKPGLLIIYSCTMQEILYSSTVMLSVCELGINAHVCERDTVPLGSSKLFISGSCPILVLTTVVCHLRRASSKKCVFKKL